MNYLFISITGDHRPSYGSGSHGRAAAGTRPHLHSEAGVRCQR